MRCFSFHRSLPPVQIRAYRARGTLSCGGLHNGNDGASVIVKTRQTPRLLPARVSLRKQISTVPALPLSPGAQGAPSRSRLCHHIFGRGDADTQGRSVGYRRSRAHDSTGTWTAGVCVSMGTPLVIVAPGPSQTLRALHIPPSLYIHTPQPRTPLTHLRSCQRGCPQRGCCHGSSGCF